MRLLLQATFAVTCMLYMASIYKKSVETVYTKTTMIRLDKF